MPRIFSKRNSPPPDRFRHDIDERTRFRILHALRQLSESCFTQFNFSELLEEVGEMLLRAYGGLRRPAYDAASRSDHPVIEHFLCCDDEMALDFIEFCFQTRSQCGGNDGVKAINEIFEDEAIGYELTDLVEINTGKPGMLFGHHAGTIVEYEYPQIVRKDEKLVHQQIIRPCLSVLSHPTFRTASGEMLGALEQCRQGHYADAITSCGSAFESVLKTICQHRGWEYDPERDTCARLVGICKDNGLFPPFYTAIFEASGTIRNKLGDAHGRGPAPLHDVSREHAEHMIHITAAHIILLTRLAQV